MGQYKFKNFIFYVQTAVKSGCLGAADFIASSLENRSFPFQTFKKEMCLRTYQPTI